MSGAGRRGGDDGGLGSDDGGLGSDDGGLGSDDGGLVGDDGALGSDDAVLVGDDALPARELDRAVELAYRAVGYRERTVAELRTFLERKRVEPAAIERAVAELAEAGFLDDARYARRFAEDKRELERWGSERIARDLHRRGIPPDLIEAAVADRSREAELDTATLLLEQRLPPPSDARERDRAWRLLVRRGYEVEIAYEAVRRHERGGGGGRQAA